MQIFSTAAAIVLSISAAVSQYSYLNDYAGDKIAYGMGNECDSQNRPLGAVDAQRLYGESGALFIGDEADKRLWLTFDEGYENGYTPQILDTLKEKNVRAVFFVTRDYCEKNPDLIRRMIDEGHTVGNHTWSHPSLPECSPDELYAELGRFFFSAGVLTPSLFNDDSVFEILKARKKSQLLDTLVLY